MSGCGKSAFMCDLISQTDSCFDFTSIAEEGLNDLRLRTVSGQAEQIDRQRAGNLVK
jgi:hypothetical protein